LDCCEHRSFLDFDGSRRLGETRSRAPRSGKAVMLTAVQSLRLFAVEMAPWFPERNALTTEQHDEFRNGHQTTKPPGFGLLRESQLSGFRQFEKAGGDEIPRSALKGKR
jgi:hypothetical protein